MTSSSALAQMPGNNSLGKAEGHYSLRSSLPDHIGSDEHKFEGLEPNGEGEDNDGISDPDFIGEEEKSSHDYADDDVNIDGDCDDDVEDKPFDESDNDDDDGGIDALLEVEEERMMKLEEEAITQNPVAERQPDRDNFSTASTNDELSDFMRERRRTMSIDVDKGSISFEIDGMPNLHTDSLLGCNLGGDDSSILASDLPPLILNKLISRSRSNSVATQQGIGRERGGSLDGILPTLMTSSSCASNINGKAGTTTTVTFAQMGESAPNGRDRTFSFEFFSFGNASECQLNVSSPVETAAGRKQGGSQKMEDYTPLVQNGRKRARTRSGSLTAPLSPTTRGRIGSLCLTLSPTISITSTSRPRTDSIASCVRPRGDSIIFDPTSFSDGGIHEQHALQITKLPCSTDETQTRDASEDGDRKVLSKAIADGESTESSQNIEQTSSAVLPDVPQVVSSSNSTPSSIVTANASCTAHSERHSEANCGSQEASVSSANAAADTGVVNPSRPSSLTGVPTVVDSDKPSTISNLPPLPGSTGDVKASGPKNPIPSGSLKAYVPGNTTSNAVAFASRPTEKVGGSVTSELGCEAITVPSCITSGTTFTMEILNTDGRIGIYLPAERKLRLELFHAKRKMRIWRKRIKYDCRKKLADSRPRIKGRFVRRSDMEEE